MVASNTEVQPTLRRPLTFEEVAALMTERGEPITPKRCRAVHSLAMKKLRSRLRDSLLERLANREFDSEVEG